MDEDVSPVIHPAPFQGGQSVITENYQLLLEELPGLRESVKRKETLRDEMEFKFSTSEVTPTSSGLHMEYTSNTRSISSSSGYSFHSANSGEQISLSCSPDSTSALSTRFCTSLNDSQISTASQSKEAPANRPYLTSEECEVSVVAWCTLYSL